MNYYANKQWAYCHKCARSFDLFDMIGLEYSKTEFKDQYEAACRKYGDYLPEEMPDEGRPYKPAQDGPKGAGRGNTPTNAPNAPNLKSRPLDGISEEEAAKQKQQMAEAEAEEQKARDKGREVIRAARAEIDKHPEALSYLQGRGFTEEAVKRIGIGFLENYPPDRRLNNRVIFPGHDGYYFARKIEEGSDRPKYLKPDGLKADVLNMGYLKAAINEPVFITEGEIDALILEGIGFRAIGLGGPGGVNKILKAIDESGYAKAEYKAMVIIPDNDKPDSDGKKAGIVIARRLLAGLKERGIPSMIIERLTEGQAEEKVDVNSAYVKDPEGFRDEMAKACEEAAAYAKDPEAWEAEQKRREYIKGGHKGKLPEFATWATARAKRPGISTGFTELDKLLSAGLPNGGLYEKLYVLGGIPTGGKTTLALQMADQIAAAGHDVIYFSLEQGYEELTSKSISRLTYEVAMDERLGEAFARSDMEVIAAYGYEGKDQEKLKDVVIKAAAMYADFKADVRIIHQGAMDEAFNRGKVQEHKKYTGQAPVVFVDFLQKMMANGVQARRDPKQNMDQVITELKNLSVDEQVPVIALSSIGRSSYGKDITMSSFKESGDIEYSCDIAMGIDFRRVKEAKETDEQYLDTERRKNPRQMYLKIMKNRNGVAGARIKFDYHQVYNSFEELDLMDNSQMEEEEI